MNLFDRMQLEHVIALCRQAKSLSAAGRLLFDVSRQGEASVMTRIGYANTGAFWSDVGSRAGISTAPVEYDGPSAPALRLLAAGRRCRRHLPC